VIDPKAEDIGRRVVYRPRGDFNREREEEGVISSVNVHYVFVRFGGTSPRGVAVHRECLEWVED